MAHRREEAGFRQVGFLRPPPRLVRDGLGRPKLGDQQVLLGAILVHCQRRRIEPRREDQDEALGADRHHRQRDEENIAAGEIDDRQGRRDRNGAGDCRDRNGRGEHRRRRHRDQGGGEEEDIDTVARAELGRDQKEERRPRDAADEFRRDEASRPAPNRDIGDRQAREVAAEQIHAEMNREHHRGPGKNLDNAEPDHGSGRNHGNEQRDDEGGAQPVLGEGQQQFVVEGRLGAGHRRQPLALGADRATDFVAMLRALAVDRRLVAVPGRSNGRHAVESRHLLSANPRRRGCKPRMEGLICR